MNWTINESNNSWISLNIFYLHKYISLKLKEIDSDSNSNQFDYKYVEDQIEVTKINYKN